MIEQKIERRDVLTVITAREFPMRNCLGAISTAKSLCSEPDE